MVLWWRACGARVQPEIVRLGRAAARIAQSNSDRLPPPAILGAHMPPQAHQNRRVNKHTRSYTAPHFANTFAPKATNSQLKAHQHLSKQVCHSRAHAHKHPGSQAVPFVLGEAEKGDWGRDKGCCSGSMQCSGAKATSAKHRGNRQVRMSVGQKTKHKHKPQAHTKHTHARARARASYGFNTDSANHKPPSPGPQEP